MTQTQSRLAGALRDLGNATGLGELAFDEDGLCRLEVENTFGISIYGEEERMALVFAGAVAETLSDEMFAAVGRDLLALALAPMQGQAPAVGYDDEADVVVAYQVYPLPETPRPAELADIFGSFIDYVAAVRNIFRNTREKLGKTNATAAPDTDAAPWNRA
jgi:hypothetical protein